MIDDPGNPGIFFLDLAHLFLGGIDIGCRKGWSDYLWTSSNDVTKKSNHQKEGQNEILSTTVYHELQ